MRYQCKHCGCTELQESIDGRSVFCTQCPNWDTLHKIMNDQSEFFFVMREPEVDRLDAIAKIEAEVEKANGGHKLRGVDYDAATAKFTIKDSGQRAQFASGMVRDTQEGKIDYWRVPIGPMFKRWAIHVTKGAVKYPDVEIGRPNWTLGSGDEELHRFKASAFRHFIQWLEGDQDEDHAAAVIFNINGAEYIKDQRPRAMSIADLLGNAGAAQAQKPTSTRG